MHEDDEALLEDTIERETLETFYENEDDIDDKLKAS